jgi:peptide/nickel transport system substrate-binding protein
MRGRSTFRTVGAAVTLAALVLVAGCGGDDDAATSATDAPATDAPATDAPATDAPASDAPTTDAPATDAPATDAPASDALAPSGTLRIAMFSDLITMDPHQASTALGYYPLVAYDSLLREGNDGNPEPWLATSWEQTSPTAWQFTLRDDVVFHDGSVFDADTVRMNFERAKAFPEGGNATFYANIAEVEVIDPTTVVVNLVAPNPGFAEAMTQTTGAMISPKAIEDGIDLTRAEAGSGGWIWDPDALREGSLHVYRANPDYWNPDAVRVETVELHIIVEPNARLNAVDSGQVDIAGDILPNQLAAARDAGLRVDVRNYKVPGMQILDLDGKIVPALGDERVRRAIGLLIDRAAIGQAIYAGEGDPTPAGLFGPESPWFCEACQEIFPVEPDVEQAKALLADAGYADGFSMDVPSNDSLALPLSAAAQMLAEANITLNVTIVPSGTVGSSNRSGEFPIVYSSITESHPANWIPTFASSDGPYNAIGTEKLRPVDELVADASLVIDQAEAEEAWDAVQVELLNIGRFFSFGTEPTAVAVTENVVGEVAPRRDRATPLPHFIELT